MWIFSSDGIIFPAIRPPHTVPEGDDRTIQIRARTARDIDRFRESYCTDLGPTIKTDKMDYDYRAYCRPEQFATALYYQALDVDYEKFKPTCDKDRQGILVRVWSALFSDLSTTDHRNSYYRIGKYAPPVKAGTYTYKVEGTEYCATCDHSEWSHKDYSLAGTGSGAERLFVSCRLCTACDKYVPGSVYHKPTASNGAAKPDEVSTPTTVSTVVRSDEELIVDVGEIAEEFECDSCGTGLTDVGMTSHGRRLCLDCLIEDKIVDADYYPAAWGDVPAAEIELDDDGAAGAKAAADVLEGIVVP